MAGFEGLSDFILLRVTMRDFSQDIQSSHYCWNPGAPECE